MGVAGVFTLMTLQPPGVTSKDPKAPTKQRQGVIPPSATRGSHRQKRIRAGRGWGGGGGAARTEPQGRGLALQGSLHLCSGRYSHAASQAVRGCGQHRARPPWKRTPYHCPVASETFSRGRIPSSSSINGSSDLCVQPTSPEGQLLV